MEFLQVNCWVLVILCIRLVRYVPIANTFLIYPQKPVILLLAVCWKRVCKHLSHNVFSSVLLGIHRQTSMLFSHC